MKRQVLKETRPKIAPFVKWAGGKRQLLSPLTKFFPDEYERYIEPFVGGGSVYFSLQHERAILGDSNRDLMNCYTVIKEHLDELIQALHGYQQHVADKDYYYTIRAQKPDILSPVEQAARFIYLNKTCYNGLYRVNQKGEFNVPFGKHERPPTLYDGDNLREISQLLQNAELIEGDFGETALLASEGDFVYLDPPYYRTPKKNSFTSYSINSFGKKEHARLAKAFQELDNKGCIVVLTNSDKRFIRNLYRDYVIKPVMTNRMINCKGSGRGNFPELIISNRGQQKFSI